MDTTTLIRLLVLLFVLLILGVWIAYLSFISRVLKKCTAGRTMEPGMVWLGLIPLFHLVWNFFIVPAVTRSLYNEFRARQIPLDNPEPGGALGIAMCVFAVCGAVPLVNVLASPAHLIVWILYWVKIAGYSRQLDRVPSPTVVQGYYPSAS
ncbi:MAG TPA: hypothetical protein VGN16_03285 [Acidobacteriaceae bacterium]|jgi:hypothetical protein